MYDVVSTPKRKDETMLQYQIRCEVEDEREECAKLADYGGSVMVAQLIRLRGRADPKEEVPS